MYRQELYKLDRNRENYLEAKQLFERAINLDSTFADAYCSLADVYISNLVWIYHYKNYNLYNLFLDSGLVIVDKAIDLKGYDFNKALLLKADYYQKKGLHTEALKCFEKLWKNRKKDHNYYLSKSEYFHYEDGYYNVINNVLLYLKFKPETEVTNQRGLQLLVYNLLLSGFPKIAKHYAEDLYKLHNDSIRHLYLIALIEIYNGNNEAALDIFIKLHELDTTNLKLINNIMESYIRFDKSSMAFEYSLLYDKIQKRRTGENRPGLKKGYLYLINGMKEEAIWNLNGALDLCKKQIALNNPRSQNYMVYKELSGIYAVQGDKENAIKNLEVLSNSNSPFSRLVIIDFKGEPFWDNIRKEPEFKKILKDLESKYRKEHDRVEKLLIREGIIEI